MHYIIIVGQKSKNKKNKKIIKKTNHFMFTTKICLIIILRVTIKFQTIYIDLCL